MMLLPHPAINDLVDNSIIGSWIFLDAALKLFHLIIIDLIYLQVTNISFRSLE